MNQRIKELAKQAGLSYLYDYDADGHAMVCSEKDIKKFAELIVAECVDTIKSNQWAKDNQAWSKGMNYSAELIKEHFGVEE